MIYAPILIPTLNRAEHLKRCLSSLCRNAYAQHTHIVISVDYPPSDKYVSGYNDVLDMLREFDFTSFSSHEIIFQKENLGPLSNSRYLISHIKGDFDRYIMTEDDNEFSPNFIEYMDKCLEYYEDDENVFCISAAKDCEWLMNDDDSIGYSKLYSPYGVGTWIRKRDKITQEGIAFLLDERSWGLKHMIPLLCRNQYLFSTYILDILCKDDGLFWENENELNFCDTPRSIYMHMTEKKCVIPYSRKSRTWGFDGSGVNMKAESIDISDYPLDENSTFTIRCTSDKFIKENYLLGNNYLKGSFFSRGTLFAIFVYIILLLSGKRISFIKRFTTIFFKT